MRDLEWRALGKWLVVSALVAFGVGVVLGALTGEAPLRYGAYGLDIAGAALIAFAFLTAEPSARRRVKQKLLGRETEPRDTSRLALVGVGVLLVAAGTAIEFAV